MGALCREDIERAPLVSLPEESRDRDIGVQDDPRLALDYLKQEVPHYWDRRQTIIALLNYLSQKPSPAMTHWEKDVEAAHLLLGAVEGEGI